MIQAFGHIAYFLYMFILCATSIFPTNLLTVAQIILIVMKIFWIKKTSILLILIPVYILIICATLAYISMASTGL